MSEERESIVCWMRDVSQTSGRMARQKFLDLPAVAALPHGMVMVFAGIVETVVRDTLILAAAEVERKVDLVPRIGGTKQEKTSH